ncbi:MAG: PEP-CTERM sorting domain-containing protein [Hyphomicrobiales bacterium]|nr:MAG: PEP-CTERM sorting domain-containing protein [Hyphomicrobiales bacterium]
MTARERGIDHSPPLNPIHAGGAVGARYIAREWRRCIKLARESNKVRLIQITIHRGRSFSDGNRRRRRTVSHRQRSRTGYVSNGTPRARGRNLQAAGASYAAFGSNGSWSFSSTFEKPGTYVIELTGDWTTRSEQYISTESASRNCYYTEPEGGGDLSCDSWEWSYYDNTDSYDYSSQFKPLSVTVEVTAVPEPEAVAMMMAGLFLVGAVVSRRQRTATSAIRR